MVRASATQARHASEFTDIAGGAPMRPPIQWEQRIRSCSALEKPASKVTRRSPPRPCGEGFRGGAAPFTPPRRAHPPPLPVRKGEGVSRRYFAALSALTSSVTAASEDLISPWKNLVTTSGRRRRWPAAARSSAPSSRRTCRRVGGLDVGDAFLAADVEGGVGTSMRAGTEPLTTLNADWKLGLIVASASAS